MQTELELSPALSQAEVMLLRAHLEGTGANLYAVAAQHLGHNVEAAVFDQLREAGLFQCEECYFWLPTCQEDHDLNGFCEECALEV